MRKNSRNARVLIYSHDTFGLGHLRRCRSIAQSLVERRKGLSVLILSGCPIIGSFDFRTRVDFVRIPGVIKLRNGEYSSLSLHMDVSEVMELRASIIQHTARIFQPDVFIVDKEPLGLRGELAETLQMLKGMGTPLILGLRDVMDDPWLLSREWERKHAVAALRDFYDEIWVYGLPQICDPLAGIALPEGVAQRLIYTGYLRRHLPTSGRAAAPPMARYDKPYILVTTGGGGDGEQLVDWVLRAYEWDSSIPNPALIVLGPFMSHRRRSAFQTRVGRLDNVEAITFDAHVEHLMEQAVGIVSMGGYNTFCEILSFDKPTVIVPRRRPRMEQFIRASRAQQLGLVRMLSDEGGREPARMAHALRNLPNQSRPSGVVVPGLLDGLDRIHRSVEDWINYREETGVQFAPRAVFGSSQT